jgi:hypothetical protein
VTAHPRLLHAPLLPNMAMELVGRGSSRYMFPQELRLPPHPHSSLPGR